MLRLQRLNPLALVMPVVLPSPPAEAAPMFSLFRFRDHMPAAGNYEGAAWPAGRELGDMAYAAWDGRRQRIWLSLNGRVVSAPFSRGERQHDAGDWPLRSRSRTGLARSSSRRSASQGRGQGTQPAWVSSSTWRLLQR